MFHWFQSFPSSTGELQRTECLRSLRDIAIPLAERPARGDLTGEVCHWADGYHLNVRLYEKLLLSVFDILDEGKLTEVRTHGSLSWWHDTKSEQLLFCKIHSSIFKLSSAW